MSENGIISRLNMHVRIISNGNDGSEDEMKNHSQQINLIFNSFGTNREV